MDAIAEVIMFSGSALIANAKSLLPALLRLLSSMDESGVQLEFGEGLDDVREDSDVSESGESGGRSSESFSEEVDEAASESPLSHKNCEGEGGHSASESDREHMGALLVCFALEGHIRAKPNSATPGVEAELSSNSS